MCKRHVNVYLKVILQVITGELGFVTGRVHKDGLLGNQAYYVTNSFALVVMDNQI
jgi:hypothetical protein